MTRAPFGVGSCPSCRQPTDKWEGYFCPRCGAHNDRLYVSEAPDPGPRSRAEIVDEYRRAGMPDDADRLAAEVAADAAEQAERVASSGAPAPTPITYERPAPPTEPTELVQRSLMDLLDSA